MITKSDIDQLSAAEKILLVEEIWDSLAADESNVLVSDEEKTLLERRWAEYKQNPGSALTLEEFKTRMGPGK